MSDLIQIGIDVKTNADQASKSIERLQGSVVNNLKVVERLEKNYKLLDRALNNNKITAQQYARGVQQVDAAIEQVLNGTLQATKATNQYANATRAATGAMNQYGKVTALGGKNLNRTNMMVQQAGYQFQDFAVQIQGGTNAFVALGQQGSQLLGIFGAKGAVLGAILAVGTAIARMGTSGKEMSFDFKGFGQAIVKSFEPIQPALDGLVVGLKFIGQVAIEAANLAINAFSLMAITVTGLGNIVLDFGKRAVDAFRFLGSSVWGITNSIAKFVVESTESSLRAILEFANSSVAAYVGLKDSVVAVFGLIPSAVGDLTIQAVNGILQSIENLLNSVIRNVNTFLEKIDAAIPDWMKGDGDGLGRLTEIDIAPLTNKFAGAASNAGAEVSKAFTDAFGREFVSSDLPFLEGFLETTEKNIEGARREANALANSLGAPVESVERLFEALKNYEAVDLRDFFKMVAKESENAGNAGEKALSDAEKAAQAYADALDNTVVSAVGGVSDAWADFVMRGFKDFKGFVGAVLDSFKNMIAQMIAMAAKNRIMLSLGIGGVAPTGAMAGSGLLQGAGILGGGGAGIGAAISGVGSGLSGVLSGGGMASSFANLGGLASGAVGGLGAVGAAIPAVGALIAGAAVLKKIFGGKKPLFSEAQFDAMADAALLTGQSFRELAADLEGVESGVVDMTRATQAVIKGIADATGGMEAFGKLAQSFFGNFYTEAEQQQYLTAKATAELNKQFAELNVAVPQTHEEYRKLVSAQDLSTEAGREMYAALLNASEAFVAVKGSAEQASAAMAAHIAERNAQADASFQQSVLDRYFQEELQSRDLETLGTTLEQNDYLIDALVRDYNDFVLDYNARRKADRDGNMGPQLSQITRETLMEVTDIDETLGSILDSTSSVQSQMLEWYTGTVKTTQEITRMIEQMILGGTATGQDLNNFRRDGDLPANFEEVYGRYGQFEAMPYILELQVFVKDRIREMGAFKRAAVDVMTLFGDYNEAFSVIPDAMMDLNDSLTGMGPKIENAASYMGQIATNFVGAFDALAAGFGKISEAVGKVNDFYKEQFSTLAAEYNVEDVATQSIDISARMSEIVEAPKRLIGAIEEANAALQSQLKKLNLTKSQLDSRMRSLAQNGMEVSESLASAYSDISNAASKANKAAKKAKKELEALKLYVSTMTQAVTDFEASVEKMMVQDIAEGVKFFEPSLLSELTGNTKLLVANILNSITEGGYAAFEEGFVRLTDMFTQNSLTVDQFNQSFGLLRDVFEGNISLTDQYTQKQASVVEKLSNAYDNLTSSLEDMLSVVSRGIGSLVGQTASANVVATRLGSLSYLSSVASGGQAEAGSLERAVSSVTSIGATDFSTRQDFMRYVADTTQLLRSVEGTLQGQVDTLEMQQVQAILGIQDTNESAATSLQSIQSLLAEFLGVGGRIPQFASGGYHSGGLRIVGENGPELEATGPSRIIPNNKISVGGDSELRREVAEMRTDLKTALVQIAKNTRKSSDTLNKFDYQGLPDSRGY